LKFKKFGWNGLFFEVPEEMRFIRQGGNAKSGNLSLEAEEYLVEARWEPVVPKKVKPLKEVAEDIVKQIKKKIKNQEVTVVRQDTAHIAVHRALYMVVKSGIEERIYLWYCDESERIVILRFVFKTFNETSKKIMKQILDTFKCHSEKSNIWALLNIRFETPISFLLTDTKITVGRAHFMLTDHKLSAFSEKTGRILIEYFSMANLIYKDTYKDLDKWFEKHYLKDLRKRLKERRIRFKKTESTRFRRHNMMVKHGKATYGLASRKTTIHTNATWYCSGTNRIYSITVTSSLSRPPFFKRELDEEAHMKLFRDLLSSFRCHGA